MHAFRKPSSLAHAVRGTSDLRRPETRSPEQSATATSGTYFRAVRPRPGEASALPEAEGASDGAKVEGLRFELDVGLWRCDPLRVAQLIVDDAEYTAVDDDIDDD
jgi:hypothetical protein